MSTTVRRNLDAAERFADERDVVSVVHTIAGLSAGSGGPSRAVVELCDAIAVSTDVRVTLLAPAQDAGVDVESKSNAVRRPPVRSGRHPFRVAALPFRDVLHATLQAQTGAIVHSHGLWMPVNYWASSIAQGHRCPLLIQPHGMLQPWALAHRRTRKIMAMSLFQRRQLESATAIIATSDSEFEGIRRLGIRTPVATLPFGLDVDACQTAAPAADRVDSSRIRTALFLSRIHPVKGLPNLLHAWQRLDSRGWRLVIAGPDEAGHLAEVLSLVRQLGLADSVQYVGEVAGAGKNALYRTADLFVLPTHSENFGMVVPEAMAHGLPVITTRGAPWAAIEEQGCGWWIDVGIEPLIEALRTATQLMDAERQRMGARGRAYVRRFSWPGIARQAQGVYRWALGLTCPPDCVRLD